MNRCKNFIQKCLQNVEYFILLFDCLLLMIKLSSKSIIWDLIFIKLKRKSLWVKLEVFSFGRNCVLEWLDYKFLIFGIDR